MLAYHRVRLHEKLGRRGLVLVLVALLMVAMLGFTALVVDIGFISLIRNEMQTAADASALAAGLELADGYGPGAVRTQSAMATRARSAGTAVAAANPMADRAHAYLNSTRDLEFGQQGLEQQRTTVGVPGRQQPLYCRADHDSSRPDR
jgi:Flp pilus assembly protein TadG